jgi:hypothetical protein
VVGGVYSADQQISYNGADVAKDANFTATSITADKRAAQGVSYTPVIETGVYVTSAAVTYKGSDIDAGATFTAEANTDLANGNDDYTCRWCCI